MVYLPGVLSVYWHSTF